MCYFILSLLVVFVVFVWVVDDGDFWYLQISVYIWYFNLDLEYNNYQDLFGFEYNCVDGVLVGGVIFCNLFSQCFNYVYLGKCFDSDSYLVYLKFIGGLLQGYCGEYCDKILLNCFGVVLVIIFLVGVCFGLLGSELVLFGNLVVMINFGLCF